MVGDTFETFGEVFQYFAKNCKTYALAANPDQMDKNGCEFLIQHSPKPPNLLQT